MQDKLSILEHFFGHKAFRPGQEELVNAILSGRDVLGIMPTGGGKSVCYQVPALILEGVTLVISPLISLMKDQVAALKSAGVDAAYINSSLTPHQVELVYQRAAAGTYKLIYVAPERLGTYGFRRMAQTLSVSLLAVDEAHCISQWGQDFRPHYLEIADFIDSLRVRPPVAAFTATATDLVREDIVRLLRLHEPEKVVTGFDRPNLYFDVRSPKDKDASLLSLVQNRRGKSGIVYCGTRSGVEEVCDLLTSAGIEATRYHAGLSEEERIRNQDDFQYDRKTCMVATNAFGMGIDKSNVSFVIHYNMPKNLEAYYQEAGRAGRDGSPADCILLFGSRDVSLATFFIENGGNENLDSATRETIRQLDYARLKVMTDYCRCRDCLRGRILDYFGQKHAQGCGNCGNCKGEFIIEDATREAQIILSCVIRVKEKLGFHVGKALLSRILRGSEDKHLAEVGLKEISTYGLLAEKSRDYISSLMDTLEGLGYAETRPPHNTYELTRKAREVLFEGKKVTLARRKEAPKPAKVNQSTRGTGEGLFDALCALRAELARREKVPAYIIFSNATLSEMVYHRPSTMRELRNIPGIGEVKAKKYGKLFLAELAKHQN